MDYNYVRMRNAAKNGDTQQAEKYRRLYEKGESRTDSHVLDVLIILLLVISVALGIYIAFINSNGKKTEKTEPTVTETVEQPGYVTQPDANREGDETADEAGNM